MVEDYDALLAPLLGSKTGDATLPVKLEVFARSDLGMLIDIALASEEILARIQQASFRHPNGFDRIVLRRDNGTKRALRLHLWGPPSISAEQDIHNHAWGFASSVLAGTFRHSIYKFERDLTGNRALYSFKNGAGDRYRYGLIDRGNAIVTSSEIVTPGQSFIMEAPTLHTFLPLECGGKTLVFHYPEGERRSSEMIRHFSQSDINEDPILQKYTIEEITTLLRDLGGREHGNN